MQDGRISKYFGTPHDPQGRPLHWGGGADFPFRGNPPVLRGNEIDDIPLVYDARSVILKLPDEQQRYDEIIDHCANGWWCLRHEKFYEPDPATGTIMVFIAWLEIYGESPKSKSAMEALKHEDQFSSQ